MTKLSPSVLPLIPSAFATGDRVSYWRCTFERLPSGTWACVTCGPAPIPFTDADIRDRFVNPPLLDALDGIPLIAPANVPADAPLPGRPVPDGENPWESGRPYLLCSTGNDVPTMLAAVQGSEPGPWGIAQAALTTPGNLCRGDVFEASMTETGTVFLRMTGGAVTLAYIPAEEPTTEESNALVEYNAMAALLDVLCPIPGGGVPVRHAPAGSLPHLPRQPVGGLMSTAVPTTDSAVRYFAEFQHGVQVTSPAEGAHRENWVKITVPRRSPDPVARFTAPYIPDSRRIGHDDLLHTNGWRALGPWEYIAGLNAYRAPVEPLRPLITAGQSAVRAAEEHGSPETVRGLDAVLCALPLVDGRADRIVHEALRAVARAEDAEEWELLADAERAVSRLIHEPDAATMEHPAVLAVAMLATRCAVNDKEAGAGVGAAWNRGHVLGLEALAAATGVACGYATGQELDNAMVAFSTAVRRAIPYAALYARVRARPGARHRASRPPARCSLPSAVPVAAVSRAHRARVRLHYREEPMPLPPFAISLRFDEHRHPDGKGNGWNEHMRLLGGRLFYFQHMYTAEGWSTVRAYERVPGGFLSVPGTTYELGRGPAWRLVHEFSLLP